MQLTAQFFFRISCYKNQPKSGHKEEDCLHDKMGVIKKKDKIDVVASSDSLHLDHGILRFHWYFSTTSCIWKAEVVKNGNGNMFVYG